MTPIDQSGPATSDPGSRARRPLLLVAGLGSLWLGLYLALPLSAQHSAQQKATEPPSEAVSTDASDQNLAVRHWVVTTAGDRIETRGPHRIDGRRVVFTDMEGALRSIRTDSVDLALSGPRPTVEEPPPQPKTDGAAPTQPAAALVLDERTISAFKEASGGAAASARDPASDDAPGRATAGAGATDRQPTTGSGAKGGPTDSSKRAALEVASWDAVDSEDAESLTVFGTLRNKGPQTAKRPRVTVFLVDERGERIAEAVARITRPDLGPGKTTNFRAHFGGFVPYTKIEFEITQ